MLGFTLGTLPFSLWIGKLALHSDIRTVGDGNPGGFNVWKAGSRFWAIVAILLDGFKGAIPVGSAYFVYGMNGWTLLPVTIAPLVGHIFSPWLKFRGGKGLSTTFGIWLGLTLWLGPTVFGLSLFVWRKTYKSNRSAVAAGLLTLSGGFIAHEGTAVNSGKIKRIRNSNKVQVTPCKMDGTPIGGWIPAHAMEIQDPETNKFVDDLLEKKYGFQKKLFAWLSDLRGDRYTVLKIELSPN